MKDIIIIAAGDDYSKEKIQKYVKETDYLIVIDGGLNIADELQLIPNLILGDFDSVKPALLKKYKNIPVETFPTNKDFTDMELGIKKALSLNTKSITIFGGTGSYFDHSLANINLLNKYFSFAIDMKIITSNSTLFVIKRSTNLTGFKDRRFSLFPLNPIKNLALRGVKYNFDKNDLSLLDYSISNVIDSDKCIIDFEKGVFLCIVFDEGYK